MIEWSPENGFIATFGMGKNYLNVWDLCLKKSIYKTVVKEATNFVWLTEKEICVCVKGGKIEIINLLNKTENNENNMKPNIPEKSQIIAKNNSMNKEKDERKDGKLNVKLEENKNDKNFKKSLSTSLSIDDEKSDSSEGFEVVDDLEEEIKSQQSQHKFYQKTDNKNSVKKHDKPVNNVTTFLSDSDNTDEDDPFKKSSKLKRIRNNSDSDDNGQNNENVYDC